MASLMFWRAGLVILMTLMLSMSLVNAEPMQCLETLVKIMKREGNETKDLFALMADATGKAVDDLGKWDECRDLGEDISHYCTVRYYVNISIPTPYTGLCLPANCTGVDLLELGYAKLNQTVEEKFHMSIEEIEKLVELNLGVSINVSSLLLKLQQYQAKGGVYQFECAQDTPSPFSSSGGVVVLIFTFLIVILVIIGTAMDGFDANWWPEPEMVTAVVTSGGSIIVSPVGGIQDEAEVRPLLHKSHTQRKSKMFEFLVAFSVVRNFKSLLGPSPPALSFLNGLRAISISWVILGHSLDYMNYTGIVNFAHVVTKDVQHASAQVFPGAEFAVDSFFWLSGFLVTYLTVQELKNKKRVNWFLYYFHRIWRLSPAYYYTLFFYMCVSVYLSDGPMWPRYVDQVEGTCGKYWWTNLLYINNFIPGVWKNQCFLWGWYLAVDMQLYIIAPIIFLIYYKNKWAGWAVIIVLLIGTVIANGMLAHEHHFVWNTSDPHEYMSMVYGKPYTRAAPWLLGIGCAFLYLERVQLSRGVVYVGWAVSATVMMLCVYGPAHQFYDTQNPLAAPVNTWIGNKSWTYITFSKLGWSLALSFLMYSMAMGWGGVVRRFLGASMWNPLARLTYSTYLWHPIIMFVVYYSHLQYFSYDHFFIAIIFVGILFLSFCTAVVMFLALERPMVNMEKIFLHKKH